MNPKENLGKVGSGGLIRYFHGNIAINYFENLGKCTRIVDEARLVFYRLLVI